MRSLIKEQQKSYKLKKNYYIFFKKYGDKYAKEKKYHNVRDHHHYRGKYRSAAHRIFDLKNSVSKEIPIAFHNGS